MHAHARISPVTILSAVSLLATSAAQAQSAKSAKSAAASSAEATPAATPAAPAAEPSVPATAGAAPAPESTAPVAPPPGYANPAPYYPTPGYAPPAGYYPPPGYAPPAGYYPPPGYPYPGYYPVQPASPPPGYHEHDGFYMRLAMGVGYLHTKASYSGQSQTVSGGAIGIDMAFGGSVTPNLAIFGALSVLSAPDPTVDYQGLSGPAYATSVDLMGFGPGIAYYFVPANLYLSAAIELSQVTASDNSSNTTGSNRSIDLTDMGFGTNLMIGKEWWVSANWGLGLAGMFRYASMKLKNDDSRMSAAGFSILFSATYN